MHTHTTFICVRNNNNNSTFWGGSVLTGEEPPACSPPSRRPNPNPSYPAPCRQDTTSPWSTDYGSNEKKREKHSKKKEKRKRKENGGKKRKKKGKKKKEKRPQRGLPPETGRKIEFFFESEVLREIVTKLRPKKNQIFEPPTKRKRIK